MYVDSRTLYISQQRSKPGAVHVRPCSLSGCRDSTLLRVTQQVSTLMRASITPVANEKRWQARRILLLCYSIDAIDLDITYAVIVRGCRRVNTIYELCTGEAPSANGMRQVMRRAGGGQGSIKVGLKMELSLYPSSCARARAHSPSSSSLASLP